MASRITLTIACDDFDHIRPLMDGTVRPEGIDLVFITDLTNPERHGAMVRNLAFDVCVAQCPDLSHRARQWCADHGDPGVLVS